MTRRRGTPLLGARQDHLGSLAVLHVGRMHHHHQHQAQGVHQQTSFAPGHLLARVIAAQPALLGRLGALTVHDPRTGLRVAPGGDPHGCAQRVMDPLPRAITPPRPDVAVHTVCHGGRSWASMRHAQPVRTA